MAIGGWETYAIGWGITIFTTVGGLLLHASYLKGKFTEQINNNQRSITRACDEVEAARTEVKAEFTSAYNAIDDRQTIKSCTDFRHYIRDSITAQTAAITKQMDGIVTRLDKLNNH